MTKLILHPDSCLSIDEDDTQSIIRYSALCRNMRMYAIHVLQNLAISTRCVPSEDDVKRTCEERKRLIEERIESERAVKAELASRIPLTDSPAVKRKKCLVGDQQLIVIY
ncbi:unnamed protein product [Rotaria magnacalcarata]|uniref:Uncharacterized protein n=2 Tax=Rotaria magnacalcarata TaxID=392030 RepID=A0A816YBV4_9BILA|nr:unnamed protein product [Rotaria magnacalcarata]